MTGSVSRVKVFIWENFIHCIYWILFYTISSKNSFWLLNRISTINCIQWIWISQRKWFMFFAIDWALRILDEFKALTWRYDDGFLTLNRLLNNFSWFISCNFLMSSHLWLIKLICIINSGIHLLTRLLWWRSCWLGILIYQYWGLKIIKWWFWRYRPFNMRLLWRYF